MSLLDGHRSRDAEVDRMVGTPSGLRPTTIALVAAAGLLLWLMLLTLPARPIGTNIDDSWNTLLAHDLRSGLQSGRDSVFTYGPLAYLFSPHPPFDPHLHTLRLLTELFGKAVMAVSLLLVLRRLGHRAEQVAFVLILVAVAPFLQDTGWLLTIAALTIGAIDPRRGQPVRIAAATAVIAVLSAAKFTLLLLGATCVAAIAASLVARRAWKPTAALLIGHCCALAVVWIAAGQQIGNLPAYLTASLEITSGYGQTMARQGPTLPMVIGAAAMLLLVVGCGAVLCTRRIQAPVACASAALGAVMFLAWKSGFVRQDEGHMLILFTATALAPFLVPRAATSGRVRLQRAAAVTTVGLSFAGLAILDSLGMPVSLAHWQFKARENLQWLVSPLEKRRALEVQTSEMRTTEALPAVRARVGSGTVDVVSFEQGVLFLNDLQVRHRPVIQSYSSYTPFLQRMNGDFYASASAPDFVLVKVQPIDMHFPTAEDSGAWRALLFHYVPVLEERGFLLVQRRASVAAGLPAPGAATEGRGRFADWIDVPADGRLHELELDIGLRLAGRLRGFLLRPPSIWLDVRLRSGDERRYSISPCLVQAPFVVDPLVDSNQALVAAYLGNGERVAAFRVSCWQGGLRWIEGEFGYRMRRNDALLPGLDGLDQRQRADLARIVFPMFSTAPIRIEPERSSWGYRVADRPAMLAEAPMRIVFALPAGRSRITARFGISEVAWTGDGATDGVTFRALLLVAGEGERELFRRHLDPKNAPDDRGFQSLDLVLQDHLGGELVLETLPGPAGDTRWDFAFWADVVIQ
ncbi:MAG TPA: hypothetical protein VF384_10625 [Planctomycetota bacterium]